MVRVFASLIFMLIAQEAITASYSDITVNGLLNASNATLLDLDVAGNAELKSNVTVGGNFVIQGTSHLKGNVTLGDGSESPFYMNAATSTGQAMPMFFRGSAVEQGKNFSGGDLNLVGGRSGLSYMRGGKVYINAGDAHRPSQSDGHNYGEIFIGTSSGKVEIGNPQGTTYFQGSANIMGTLIAHGGIRTSLNSIEIDTGGSHIDLEDARNTAVHFKSDKGGVIISGERKKTTPPEEDIFDGDLEGGNVTIHSGGRMTIRNNGTGISMYERRSNKKGQLCCYLVKGVLSKSKNSTLHYTYPDENGKCLVDLPRYEALSEGDECAIKSSYIDFHANKNTFMKMSTENSTKMIEVSVPLAVDSFLWTTSDRRVMRDVKNTTFNHSLDIIRQLQLREYKLTDAFAKATGVKSNTMLRGFIGDEVASVFSQYPDSPPAVMNKDRFFAVEEQDNLVVENMSHVQYDAIYMEMFNAVKALIAQRDQMTSELEELRTSIQNAKTLCGIL